MSGSPHKIANLALARDTLTNATLLAGCTPEHRAELVRLAQAILQTDRVCRLGLDVDSPKGPARVIRIPRAVFQAGRIRNHARRVTEAHPTTPGDAA